MEKNKEKVSGKIFDYQVFKKIMVYAKVYKLEFFISVVSVLLLAVLGAVNPLLIQKIIDVYLADKNWEMLLNFSLLMFAVLLGEVIVQFLFIFS